MTTKLEKMLKREITVKGRTYIVAISPEGLMLTVKGRRKGLQLLWTDLVTGEAALAVALQASVGKFGEPTSRNARKKGTRPPRSKKDSEGTI